MARSLMARSLDDAQHEAAHVVVGVALGLRLWRVTLDPATLPKSWRRWEGDALAVTAWEPKPWPREADLLMTAAGVAWERRYGDITKARGDLQILRRAGVRGNARLVVLERAAMAILESRHALHTRVTRALVERDLTGRDVRTLVRGERLAD